MIAAGALRITAAEITRRQNRLHADVPQHRLRGETDLRLMVKSPRAYIDSRFDFKKPGKLNTFKHYFKIGGLSLVWRVLTYQRTYGDNPHPDDVPAAQ